jgi:hypothetical protein
VHRLAADLEGEGQELARRVGVAPGLRRGEHEGLHVLAAPEPRRYAYAPGQFLTFAFEIGGETVHRCYSDRHGVRPGRRRGEGVAAMHRLAADLEGEGQELARRPTTPWSASPCARRRTT